MIGLVRGAMKLWTGAIELAGRILGGVGDWLKAEHDWWRMGCLSMAFVVVCLTFAVLDARQEVDLVQAQCDATQAKASADLDRMRTERDACVANEFTRRAVERKGTAAVSQARQAEVQAEKDLAAWRESYLDRSADCTAALNALETACPVLRGY